MEFQLRRAILIFIILILGIAFALPSDHDFPDKDIHAYDVCVIGGGSAGTYAAIRLHDMGKKVLVIEKEDHLGGHVSTYVDETGEVINVGVQVFHNLTIVRDYFQRLGVALGPDTSLPFPTTYLDFDTGEPVPGFVPPSPAAIGAALQTYAGIIAEKYSYLEAGYYLPDPVPEELLMPFGEFAVKYGLEAIALILNEYTQNNGEFWKQPTLYVIKAFGLALIQSIEQGFLATHDLSDLYTSAAHVLQGNVLYSSEIVSMDRAPSHGSAFARLKVRTPDGLRLIRARKLLMTGPPMLNNLVGWDLSVAETSVFTKFSALGYFAGVIHNDGIPETSDVENLGTYNPSHINSLPGCFMIIPTDLPGKHLVYYGTNFPVSSHVAQSGIVEQIDRLAARGNWPPAQTTFVYWTDHTPYRLYTSVDEIREGFYRKLYALQGCQNTYWSGAAWMTHDSSLIWEFTERLLPALAS